MTRPLVALAILLSAAVAGRAADPKEVVAPRAEKFLEGKTNAGLVVGIWAGGVPHVYGFGTVSLPTGDQTPAGDTLFEIGSITKAFTGVLLAEAVRRGEVDLDAPAEMFLPPDIPLPKVGAVPITLGHLATHRSGLPAVPLQIALLPKDRSNPYAGFDRKQLHEYLTAVKPTDEPGEKYRYSNLGAGLAGHAAVHAAKAESYDALVRDRVCRPLGMRDTAEAPTGAQRARLARGHDKDGEPVPGWDMACMEGCGALKSTADDLLRFAAANLGDTKTDLLPTLRLSHEPRAKGHGDKEEVGLFWHRRELAGGRVCVWHNGGTGGFRSMLALVPATKTAVVALCSTYQSVDGLAMDVLRELQPKD